MLPIRFGRDDSDEEEEEEVEEGRKDPSSLLSYFSEEGGCLICPVNNRKEDATPHLHLHHKRATVFRAYSRISLDLVAASSAKKEASLAGDRRPRISPRFFLLLEKKKKEFKEEREKERGEKRWVEVGNPRSRR